jgi:acetyltransferase-like isoleucine patch superfamily enzyme
VTSPSLDRQLRDLYEAVRADVRERWQRELPLDEMIFDRQARAAAMGFGVEASIYHNSYVYGDVQVGDHTWIGPFTILDGSGIIRIGRYCSISSGVQIYSHDTVRWAVSGGACPYERAPVVIGDCCHIGSQTVIAKGVNIGDHAVVGACSFVNRDIPSRAIAVGAPCRVIGRVVGDGEDVRFEYGQAEAGPEHP